MFFIKKKKKKKKPFIFIWPNLAFICIVISLFGFCLRSLSSLKIRMIFTCILEVSLMMVKTLILLEFIETHLMFHVDDQLLSFIY